MRLRDLLLQLRHAARLLKRVKRVPADALTGSGSAPTLIDSGAAPAAVVKAAAATALTAIASALAAVSAYDDL